MIPGGWRYRFSLGGDPAKKLVRYGGWVTVSQVISPLFQYVDRFLIASILTLSAVAYYSIPQEIVLRLLVIPMSLSLVLFPSFSTTKEWSSSLYARSVKYLLVVLLPVTLAVVAFAPEFLTWWIGSDFARGSTPLLQILAVGFLFNAMAQLPATALLARGYPEIVAKLHLLEIVPTLVLTAFLLLAFGLPGAALGWSLRVAVDCVLLFVAAHRLLPNMNKTMWGIPGLRGVGAIAAALVLYVAGMILPWSETRIALTGSSLGVYAVAVWIFLFDASDRAVFHQLRIRFFEES